MKEKPDPLVQLAAIQRRQPGKLASWLRAQRPVREPTNCAHFVTSANLNVRIAARKRW